MEDDVAVAGVAKHCKLALGQLESQLDIAGKDCDGLKGRVEGLRSQVTRYDGLLSDNVRGEGMARANQERVQAKSTTSAAGGDVQAAAADAEAAMVAGLKRDALVETGKRLKLQRESVGTALRLSVREQKALELNRNRSAASLVAVEGECKVIQGKFAARRKARLGLLESIQTTIGSVAEDVAAKQKSDVAAAEKQDGLAKGYEQLRPLMALRIARQFVERIRIKVAKGILNAGPASGAAAMDISRISEVLGGPPVKSLFAMRHNATAYRESWHAMIERYNHILHKEHALRRAMTTARDALGAVSSEHEAAERKLAATDKMADGLVKERRGVSAAFAEAFRAANYSLALQDRLGQLSAAAAVAQHAAREARAAAARKLSEAAMDVDKARAMGVVNDRGRAVADVAKGLFARVQKIGFTIAELSKKHSALLLETEVADKHINHVKFMLADYNGRDAAQLKANITSLKDQITWDRRDVEAAAREGGESHVRDIVAANKKILHKISRQAQSLEESRADVTDVFQQAQAKVTRQIARVAAAEKKQASIERQVPENPNKSISQIDRELMAASDIVPLQAAYKSAVGVLNEQKAKVAKARAKLTAREGKAKALEAAVKSASHQVRDFAVVAKAAKLSATIREDSAKSAIKNAINQAFAALKTKVLRQIEELKLNEKSVIGARAGVAVAEQGKVDAAKMLRAHRADVLAHRIAALEAEKDAVQKRAAADWQQATTLENKGSFENRGSDSWLVEGRTRTTAEIITELKNKVALRREQEADASMKEAAAAAAEVTSLAKARNQSVVVGSRKAAVFQIQSQLDALAVVISKATAARNKAAGEMASIESQFATRVQARDDADNALDFVHEASEKVGRRMNASRANFETADVKLNQAERVQHHLIGAQQLHEEGMKKSLATEWRQSKQDMVLLARLAGSAEVARAVDKVETAEVEALTSKAAAAAAGLAGKQGAPISPAMANLPHETAAAAADERAKEVAESQKTYDDARAARDRENDQLRRTQKRTAALVAGVLALARKDADADETLGRVNVQLSQAVEALRQDEDELSRARTQMITSAASVRSLQEKLVRAENEAATLEDDARRAPLKSAVAFQKAAESASGDVSTDPTAAKAVLVAQMRDGEIRERARGARRAVAQVKEAIKSAMRNAAEAVADVKVASAGVQQTLRGQGISHGTVIDAAENVTAIRQELKHFKMDIENVTSNMGGDLVIQAQLERNVMLAKYAVDAAKFALLKVQGVERAIEAEAKDREIAKANAEVQQEAVARVEISNSTADDTPAASGAERDAVSRFGKILAGNKTEAKAKLGCNDDGDEPPKEKAARKTICATIFAKFTKDGALAAPLTVEELRDLDRAMLGGDDELRAEEGEAATKVAAVNRDRPSAFNLANATQKLDGVDAVISEKLPATAAESKTALLLALNASRTDQMAARKVEVTMAEHAKARGDALKAMVKVVRASAARATAQAGVVARADAQLRNATAVLGKARAAQEAAVFVIAQEKAAAPALAGAQDSTAVLATLEVSVRKTLRRDLLRKALARMLGLTVEQRVTFISVKEAVDTVATSSSTGSSTGGSGIAFLEMAADGPTAAADNTTKEADSMEADGAALSNLEAQLNDFNTNDSSDDDVARDLKSTKAASARLAQETTEKAAAARKAEAAAGTAEAAPAEDIAAPEAATGATGTAATGTAAAATGTAAKAAKLIRTYTVVFRVDLASAAEGQRVGDFLTSVSEDEKAKALAATDIPTPPEVVAELIKAGFPALMATINNGVKVKSLSSSDPGATGGAGASIGMIGGLADETFLAQRALDSVKAAQYMAQLTSYRFESESVLAGLQITRDSKALQLLLRAGATGGAVSESVGEIKSLQVRQRLAQSSMATAAIKASELTPAVAAGASALDLLSTKKKVVLGQELAQARRAAAKMARRQRDAALRAADKAATAASALEQEKIRAAAKVEAAQVEAKSMEEADKAKIAAAKAAADATVRAAEVQASKDERLTAEHNKLLADEARIEKKEMERAVSQEKRFDQEEAKLDSRARDLASAEAANRIRDDAKLRREETDLSKDVVKELSTARENAQEVATNAVKNVQSESTEATTEAKITSSEIKANHDVLKEESLSHATRAQDALKGAAAALERLGTEEAREQARASQANKELAAKEAKDAEQRGKEAQSEDDAKLSARKLLDDQHTRENAAEKLSEMKSEADLAKSAVAAKKAIADSSKEAVSAAMAGVKAEGSAEQQAFLNREKAAQMMVEGVMDKAKKDSEALTKVAEVKVAASAATASSSPSDAEGTTTTISHSSFRKLLSPRRNLAWSSCKCKGTHYCSSGEYQSSSTKKSDCSSKLLYVGAAGALLTVDVLWDPRARLLWRPSHTTLTHTDSLFLRLFPPFRLL